MKILFVCDGIYPQHVNGVSIYLHSLVHELCSYADIGRLHVVNSSVFNHLKLTETKNLATTDFGLQNAPLYIGDSLDKPLRSLRHPKVENIFTSVLNRYRPDLVHFHEMHRFPASLIEIALGRNAAVVATLHDYWFLCPLFQLFTPQETVCTGPEGGKNCVVTCLAGDRLTRTYRRALRILNGSVLETVLLKMRNSYKMLHGEPVWQTGRNRVVEKNLQNLSLKKKIGELGEREQKLLKILASVHMIHAVSSDSADVYIRHGIPSNKIKTLQLGVPASAWLNKRTAECVKEPLKVGFLGHLGPGKGVQVLLEAIAYLHGGCEIHLHGKGRSEDVDMVKRYAKSEIPVVYHGPYHYRQLQQILDTFHCLVIPSLCRETLGLIGLEAQAAGVPVIASRIGGMTDYVKHGVNGYLFEPGNAEDLAQQLKLLTDNPDKVRDLSQRAMRPDDMKAHTRKLLHFYRDAMDICRREQA